MIYKVALFALVVSLFSCSPSYQLLETKPTSSGFTESKELCFENDTIRICYSFWAEKGILNYSIYNKLNIPIYIDWVVGQFENK